MNSFKALGLTLVIGLAFGAIAATEAVATEGIFRSDGAPTILGGSQIGESTFEFDAGKISCKKATYSGVQSETTTSVLELAPVYAECSGLGGVVEVDMNGCRFTLRSTVDVGPPPKFTASIGLDCPTTGLKKDEIEITVIILGLRTCTIHVPEQSIESSGTLTNGETKEAKDITSDSIITSLKYSQQAGEGLSACANAAGTTNGKYTDQMTLTGKNESGKATSIWVE